MRNITPRIGRKVESRKTQMKGVITDIQGSKIIIRTTCGETVTTNISDIGRLKRHQKPILTSYIKTKSK